MLQQTEDYILISSMKGYTQMDVKCFADLMSIPEGTAYQSWYFGMTGGISYRLKLCYLLALELEKQHGQGLYYGSIQPEDVIIKSADQLQIIKTANRSISIVSDCYTDPLVLCNRCMPSFLSDTFSYAIILFKLLTLCHPFIGDELSQEDLQEAAIPVSSSQYIGIIDGSNSNERYEYQTSVNIGPNLATLFRRMFVDGKTKPEERPSIADFKLACLQSLRQIHTCNHHNKTVIEYYSKQYICPYCMTTNLPYAKVSFGLHVESKNAILLPDSLTGNLQKGCTDITTGEMNIYADEVKITESCFSTDTLSMDTIMCTISHRNVFDRYGNKRSLIKIKNKGLFPINSSAWPEPISPNSEVEKDDDFDILSLTTMSPLSLLCNSSNVYPYGDIRIFCYMSVDKGGNL